jgi:hypothetical protein
VWEKLGTRNMEKSKEIQVTSHNRKFVPLAFCFVLRVSARLDHLCAPFLGMFEKLQRPLLALLCLSVELSVHPHGTTRLPLDGFLQNFSKI